MNELPLFLDIGSLVRTSSGTRHNGKLGIVTRMGYRCPATHTKAATVFYPETGEEIEWSEYCLEVVA